MGSQCNGGEVLKEGGANGGRRRRNSGLPKETVKRRPIKVDDNFGPEDIGWIGKDEIDQEGLVREHGIDPEPPLEVVFRALIEGHIPHVSNSEIRERIRCCVKAVGAKPSTGRSVNDDRDALHEIAWRVHEETYRLADRAASPKLRPIVRAVVQELFDKVPTERNIAEESYTKKLEDKFKAQRNLLVSCAIMDMDYDRMGPAKEIRKALEALNKLGIPVDTRITIALPLRKNKTRKDETPPDQVLGPRRYCVIIRCLHQIKGDS